MNSFYYLVVCFFIGALRAQTDEQTSIELLKFWRTHIEPWGDADDDDAGDDDSENEDTRVVDQ